MSSSESKEAPRLRPATYKHRSAVRAAQYRLRAALDDAKEADCPKLVQSIRRAIKSADGAFRHVERRRAATSQRSDQP